MKTILEDLLFQYPWIKILLVMVCSGLASCITSFYLIKLLNKIITRSNINLKEQEKIRFIKPLKMACFLGIWILALPLVLIPEDIFNIIHKISIIGITISLIVFSYNFVDVLLLFFKRIAQKTEDVFDDLAISLISKISKFLIIIFGFIFIGEGLSIDTKNILAGLGIGGLAIAFAAKDTLSNLFGSFTILTDRPFKIGDWISIDSGREGIVENVGLRSTRIRTFYDSLIVIPNGQLTNINIDNYGKRKFRRMNISLGLKFDTPAEKIEAFCESIRQLILSHKYTRKDYFHVYVNSFSQSSVNILLYVFWQVPNWSTELMERHRLLVDILRLAKELSVEFSFPTRTLHLFSEKHSIPDTLQGNIHQVGKQKAKKIAKNPISTKKHRSGTEKEDFEEEGIFV